MYSFQPFYRYLALAILIAGFTTIFAKANLGYATEELTPEAIEQLSLQLVHEEANVIEGEPTIVTSQYIESSLLEQLDLPRIEDADELFLVNIEGSFDITNRYPSVADQSQYRYVTYVFRVSSWTGRPDIIDFSVDNRVVSKLLNHDERNEPFTGEITPLRVPATPSLTEPPLD